MHFTKIASLMASLLVATQASPIADPAEKASSGIYAKRSAGLDEAHVVSGGTIEKRANVGVYLCVDAGFEGYCVHIVQPANECSKIYLWHIDMILAHGSRKLN